MAKAVTYTFLTAAFIIFMTLSPIKQKNPDRYGRRLGSTTKHLKLQFDPLMAKIEIISDEKGISHGDHVVDPINLEEDKDSVVNAAANEYDQDVYDFYDDEGKLNMRLRLNTLFPMIDTTPKDGFITLDELKTWNMKQAEDRLSYITLKEYRSRDKDKDERISFSEYLPHFSQEDIAKNEMEHGEAGWWRLQYDNADFDRSGSLDFDEFNHFLHPEDSSNEEIQKWVLSEKIRGMDKNSDGKLDFAEFRDHTYSMYKTYVEFETHGDHVPSVEKLFDELDTNKDGYLVVGELRPILSYLQPGERSYSKYYSSYLTREADDNKDGQLSLDEMLNHEQIFYTTVDDDGSDYDSDIDNDNDNEL